MVFLEDVFVTEGRPTITYVDPPNYAELLTDIRSRSKPVIIEGQSGTGKTTAVRSIVERIFENYTYLTPRNPADINAINEVSKGNATGIIVIDDFHRLELEVQENIANIAKAKADLGAESALPKLVIIGINRLGETLIQGANDIGKRLGIHRIEPASEAQFASILSEGEKALNVKIENSQDIWADSRGDYWLIQRLLKLACTQSGVTEKIEGEARVVNIPAEALRTHLSHDLSSAYQNAVKEFCRGRRFRPGNDPYLKLLKAVSEQEEPLVDITKLANTRDDLRQSIYNIKDKRLRVLLDEKADLKKYFYYNPGNTCFSIEDQALFFYIKHLDWDALRLDCGFRSLEEEREFDVAISFAGENRGLAEIIASRLSFLDFNVFYDRYYEANYLGKAWTKEFERIFANDSRFVICLLDSNYREKIWPTFERATLKDRVPKGEVLPIYLDDTNFVEIPSDVIGITFKGRSPDSVAEEDVDRTIIDTLINRLDRDS